MDWEAFNTVLNYISGPLVGAIIGYITNFIAVKMLFHPYNPIKIFGFTLPFTPGIIPKRKPKLAGAIGKAVGDKLFTGDDLASMLTSDEMKTKVSTVICDKAVELSEKTPKELLLLATDENGAESICDTAVTFISDKVMESAHEIDLGSIIAERGGDVIREKKSSLGMFGMFITDDLINSLLEQLKEKVNEYIESDGRALICEKAQEKSDSVFNSPVSGLLGEYTINKNVAEEKIGEIYGELVKKALASLSDSINISKIVEDKVNAMSVKELETLCMSVMKRELGAVINLGALIGFIIGIINIFV
ncbi:MAG: DUF445 family protein [Clostridia bacterium]|nr:DUF445 family protein [Clostridia bacterium]